jgi:hypothetical protein
LTSRGGTVAEFSTFWIKIGLNSLPERGKYQRSGGKYWPPAGGAAPSANPRSETADYAARLREGEGRMRVMFLTWLTLIAAGLVFYAVIGLTHH